MRDVYVVGVHTLKFGKYPDQSIKNLAAEALQGVLADAGIQQTELGSVWFANSGWGEMSFQHCIRGQVALRPSGLEGLPITNVENACAGGSTAFHGAWKDVAGGFQDVALALGVEKVYCHNRYQVFASFLAGTDTENIVEGARHALGNLEMRPQKQQVRMKKQARLSWYNRVKDWRDQAVTGIHLGETLGYSTVRTLVRMTLGQGDHSPFMDIYGFIAREHMRKYGSTQQQMAIIASKNHAHSSLNPNAQYRFLVTPEEVLEDREVAYPLTRSMCAPIGDGAASAILMSGKAVRQFGLGHRAVRVRASILGSGRDRGDDEPDIGQRLSEQAYAAAGISPQDLDCVELHDATAFGELHQTEALGLFARGEGGPAAERGETRLGGRIPVNTSGGLLSRGHPIGASGLAQIHELIVQLRGEAGPRQVQGARMALAENGGGALGKEEAAMGIHIFERTNG